MSRIRSFLAVDFRDFYQAELDGLIRGLKKNFPGVKWCRSDAAHLTLNFFGDIDEETVPGIIRELTPVTQDLAPFELKLARLGAFPDFSRPRVLWAGFAGETNTLLELKKRADQALEKIGLFPEERTFHPHLTLGRIHQPGKRAQLPDAMLDFASPNGFTVKSLTLFRSDLGAQGARHIALHEFQF